MASGWISAAMGRGMKEIVADASSGFSFLSPAGRGARVFGFARPAFPFHRAARLLPVNDPWKYFSDQRLHNLMKSWGARKDEIDPSTLQELAQRFRRDARLAFVYEKNRKLWKLKAPIVSIVSEDDSLTKHYLSKYRRWEKVSAQVRLFVLKHGGHYFVGERAAAVAKIVHYIKKHHSTLFTDTEAVVKWD